MARSPLATLTLGTRPINTVRKGRPMLATVIANMVLQDEYPLEIFIVDTGPEVAAAAVQVNAHRVVRQLGVPVADRLSDKAVLLRRRDEPLERVTGSASHAGDVGADHGHGLDEVGVRRGAVDRLVELTDQRVVFGDGSGRSRPGKGVPGTGEAAHVGVERGGLSPTVRHVQGGQAGRLGFEAGTHLEQRVDVVAGDLGHHDTPPTRGGDEAVGSKPCECLAQWCAGDAEPGCLLDLPQPQAGDQGAVQDFVVQLPVCAVARPP